MADPFASADSAAPSQPAPAAAKRKLFFKNRRRSQPQPEEPNDGEAVDFFSRSKEIFPEAIRERREKREREEKRKKDKEGQARRREEERVQRELADKETEERKRRVVLDSDEEDGWDKEEKMRGWKKSTSMSHSSTPPRDTSEFRTTHSPPRHSPRDTRRTRSKPDPIVISLESSDVEDTNKSPGAFGCSSPVKPHRNRSPSVEQIPPPPEEEQLFPELVAQARAQAAAEQVAKLKELQAKQRLKRIHSNGSNRSGSGSGSPLDLDVIASGSNVPTPTSSPVLMRNEEVKPDPIISILVDSHIPETKPLVVKRKLSQRFRDVRMAWCDAQVLHDHRPMMDQEKDNIFLTWRGRRVWDVTTAESLGIKVDSRRRVVAEEDAGGYGGGGAGNVHLEAWTKDFYDNWQKEKKEEKRRIAVGLLPVQEQINLEDSAAVASDAAAEQGRVEAEQVEAQHAPSVEKIKIVLKAKGDEPVKLIVKTTTLIDTIVGGFKMQRKELCEGKKVELWFDGDRLEEESTIADADVEDMSSIDVVLKDA